MSNPMPTHTEQIKCPSCGTVQDATVEHTEPFYCYVHDCDKCGYTITESEWERLDNATNQTRSEAE
jgi:C4-type Zn-finger protein